MSNKIKYYIKRDSEPVEFQNTVVRIELPNGDEYTLKYDEREKGLVINKAFSESEPAIRISPHVSNEIMIK